MTKPPCPQLIRDDKTFEWIAGPYKSNERWMLEKQIKEFQKTGVHITEETIDGATFLYRDKKGYIQQPRTPEYVKRGEDNFKYRPSDTRRFLEEVKREVAARRKIE